MKQRFDDGERIALEFELLNISLAEYRQRFPECAVSSSWESLNVDVRRDTDRIVSRCLFSRVRSFFDEDDDSESIRSRVCGFVGRVINIDPLLSYSECSFENVHSDKTQPTLLEFLEPVSSDPERRRRQNQYVAALHGEYLLRFVILLNVVGTHRV